MSEILHKPNYSDDARNQRDFGINNDAYGRKLIIVEANERKLYINIISMVFFVSLLDTLFAFRLDLWFVMRRIRVLL